MKKTEWPRIKVNKLYKLLDKNGFSYDCGDAEYSLPTKREDGTWEPGEWMTGYHLCREEDILRWLKFDVNESIFEAECRGEIIENRGILVARKARLVRKCNENWNEKTVRLFACWCVREVWNLLSDKRSKQAVEIAERFANGNASKEELRAARFAAWDAEDEASYIAAWAGQDRDGPDPYTSSAEIAVKNAAWHAAKAAAEVASDDAWAAVKASAGYAAVAERELNPYAADATRAKQSRELLEMIRLES